MVMAAVRNDLSPTRMSATQLRALWKATFGRPHPSWVQKDFLFRVLDFYIQEKAYGSLAPAVRRRLFEYAKEFQAKGRIARAESLPDQARYSVRPRAGTVQRRSDRARTW